MDAARSRSRRRHHHRKGDAKEQAWQKAKADADEVEHVALGKCTQRGEHARKEAGLLDRIRTEENADELGEAWLYIERHQNSPIDGQRVIRAALHALTLSENAVRVPEGYHSSLRRLKGLITAVDQLQEYFCKDIKRDPPWKS